MGDPDSPRKREGEPRSTFLICDRLQGDTGVLYWYPWKSSGLLCQPLEVVVAKWVDVWYVVSVSSVVGRYVALGVT